MDKQAINSLKTIAEEFGAIAKKVNESSKMRKSHSEEALKFIDNSIEIGEVLVEDLDTVATADAEMRKQDNVILNTSLILKSNIEKQQELLEEIKKSGAVDAGVLQQCEEKINNFAKDIDEAIGNIRQIVEMDNKIIFMEKQIIMRKQFQQSSLRMLKEIATMSLHDAENAIKGSSSNLDRGLDMVERFKNVDKLISEKNMKELEDLIKEANLGWNIAVDVNNSSTSQYKFAEEVNQFTKQLHKDSTSIKDMVVLKHKIFEDNLQLITVLTVVISLKFKKYLDIEDIVEQIEFKEEIVDQLNQFIINVKIACNDIRDLNTLNYDMADASHLNNEIEDKTVKATKTEMECFDRIKKEVEEMTESTKYPIEGSGNNITNGKKLEELLKNIINEMKV